MPIDLRDTVRRLEVGLQSHERRLLALEVGAEVRAEADDAPDPRRPHVVRSFAPLRAEDLDSDDEFIDGRWRTVLDDPEPESVARTKRYRPETRYGHVEEAYPTLDTFPYYFLNPKACAAYHGGCRLWEVGEYRRTIDGNILWQGVVI